MTRALPDDPIAELSHDQGDLTGLVQAVREAFARVERGQVTLKDAHEELEDGAEALREGLLVHFGREEEALFPFVERHVPSLRPRVAALLAEHDTILQGAAALCLEVAAAHDAAGSRQASDAWAAFEARYAEHVEAEGALLRDVDLALDAASRAELGALLCAV
jgi:hemerythrin-like domain-containing protein